MADYPYRDHVLGLRHADRRDVHTVSPTHTAKDGHDMPNDVTRAIIESHALKHANGVEHSHTDADGYAYFHPDNHALTYRVTKQHNVTNGDEFDHTHPHGHGDGNLHDHEHPRHHDD